MITYDYELEITGKPIPQGRARGRAIQSKDKSKKAFVTIYDPTESKNAKAAIKKQVSLAAPKELLDCPLRVDIAFYFARPQNHFRTGKFADQLRPDAPCYHTTKPDVDNLRKLAMDALTGVFWRDDSLICRGETRKYYSDNPRTIIKIQKLS